MSKNLRCPMDAEWDLCQKENCAWWQAGWTEEGKCAVLAIAQEMVEKRKSEPVFSRT